MKNPKCKNVRLTYSLQRYNDIVADYHNGSLSQCQNTTKGLNRMTDKMEDMNMVKSVKFKIRGKIWVLRRRKNSSHENEYIISNKATLDIFIHCTKIKLTGPWDGIGNWLYLQYSDVLIASMWIDNLTDYTNLREFIDGEE